MARKLSGEISPLEMEELELLLKEAPSAHLKIQILTELWNSSIDLQHQATEQDFQKHLQKLKEYSPTASISENTFSADLPQAGRTRSKKWLAVGVWSLLFVFVVVGILFFFRRNRGEENSLASSAETPNMISTKHGSRTKIDLPDGSVVWLNSGSKLTYDKHFGTSLREVYLSGEGFFDVVHNEDKPFIIHTTFFDIKDLGTQFNVKCYPEDKTTETSLVEGSVEIVVKKRPDEKWVLKPDEKLVLLNDSSAISRKIDEVKNPQFNNEPIIALKKLTYTGQDSFSVETAWTYNKLSFEDEAFGEVAKKMARWYAAEFEFKNVKQEEIHMSGTFVSESLEQAMEALKYTNRFNYIIKDGKVTIY